jgi:hypothetical protein
MEELKLPDFDEWIKTFKVPEVNYLASFDDTGRLTKVGPDHIFSKDERCIELSKEMAEEIISGKIHISKCFVDVKTGSVEIAQVEKLFKIDDMLHRIVAKEWTDVEIPDVYITYKTKTNELVIELTEALGGTYILPDELQPVPQRKMVWDGETTLKFMLTDYNDPHIIHKVVEVKLHDLVENAHVVTDVELPNSFSVYTRRLLKDYVLEIV